MFLYVGMVDDLKLFWRSTTTYANYTTHEWVMSMHSQQKLISKSTSKHIRIAFNNHLISTVTVSHDSFVLHNPILYCYKANWAWKALLRIIFQPKNSRMYSSVFSQFYFNQTVHACEFSFSTYYPQNILDSYSPWNNNAKCRWKHNKKIQK